MSYSDTLYKRGYLITDCNSEYVIPDTIESWNVNLIGGYEIRSCPSLEFEDVQGSNYSLAIIGMVLDPVNKIDSTTKILSNLQEVLSKGRGQFLDYLDFLSGRFVLFVDCTEPFVVQDATGARSLYYDTKLGELFNILSCRDH